MGVGRDTSINPQLNAIPITYRQCDLTDSQQVSQLDLSGISSIINLAGIANVQGSAGKGTLYNHINVAVHTVLYEECLKQNVSPLIIAVSSGAVYDSNQPMPLTEDSSLIPDENTNEYVISKKRAEDAIIAFNRRGLRCVVMRPFNHTGPGQLPGFLIPDLYEQLISAADSNNQITVGNLKTKRDFTDVRDVARAYVDLALSAPESISHDIYNVCSGISVSGEEILELLVQACGISRPEIRLDPKRIRNNEVMEIFGSAERLYSATKWMSNTPLQKTIEDFVKVKRS